MGKVCVISIYAHDLDQAAEFYSGVLGLKVKHKMPYVVVLDHDGVDLVLCQAELGLVHDAPQDFPEGQFVAFRDPSGNVHESLEFTK